MTPYPRAEGGEDMSETTEQIIIRSWKTSPDIREEFLNDFKAYAAFSLANAAGKVKIQGK